MAAILGLPFSAAVEPLIQRLIKEARAAGGADCVYAVATPELRAAVFPPVPGRDAEGVFLRIVPTATGATVLLRKALQNGDPRPLTTDTIDDILADIPIWLKQVKETLTRAEGSHKGVRNPAWTRDELILALDLYFEIPPWTISGKHPAVASLSAELGRLSAYTDAPDKHRYRNANGVYMKLMNLQHHDPSRDGRGLKGGGALEPVIWKEYADDREKLEKVAKAIRLSIASGMLDDVPPDAADLDDYAEAIEGRILTRTHRIRERDSKLKASKKAAVLKATGRLDCEACHFNFKDRYGDHGDDFIEVHHLMALSELPEQTKTRLEDLALLCANCHRMIHRQKPWLTMEGLRALLMEKSDC